MILTQELQLIVLQPQERLDLQGGKVLKEQLTVLVSQSHKLWTIDFAEVNFMDSFGLVALVKGLQAACQSSRRLVLCNVQASIRLIFDLTQLDSVFEIFESYDAVLLSTKFIN